MGFEEEDEDGELVEPVERVPCRRCNRESLLPWTNTYGRAELRLTLLLSGCALPYIRSVNKISPRVEGG